MQRVAGAGGLRGSSRRRAPLRRAGPPLRRQNRLSHSLSRFETVLSDQCFCFLFQARYKLGFWYTLRRAGDASAAAAAPAAPRRSHNVPTSLYRIVPRVPARSARARAAGAAPAPSEWSVRVRERARARERGAAVAQLAPAGRACARRDSDECERACLRPLLFGICAQSALTNTALVLQVDSFRRRSTTCSRSEMCSQVRLRMVVE